MTQQEETLLAKLLTKLLDSDLAKKDMVIYRTARGLLLRLIGK